jgi:hypothetical protein
MAGQTPGRVISPGLHLPIRGNRRDQAPGRVISVRRAAQAFVCPLQSVLRVEAPARLLRARILRTSLQVQSLGVWVHPFLPALIVWLGLPR